MGHRGDPASEANGLHPSSLGRRHTVLAVLNHDAAGRDAANLGGGIQEEIGLGLAPLNLAGAEDTAIEEVPQASLAQRATHLGVGSAGSHAGLEAFSSNDFDRLGNPWHRLELLVEDAAVLRIPRLLPPCRHRSSEVRLDVGEHVGGALTEVPLDHLGPGDRPPERADRLDVDGNGQSFTVNQDSVAVEDDQAVRGRRHGAQPNNAAAPLRLADVSEDQVGQVGQIEFVPDDDGRGGVTVMMDGSPQSHVDLADPGNLGFEYIAHFAAVIDTLPAGPLGITHIGGAGLTLARYVNAERPGSPQIVLEPNAELTELVRRELPLPRQHRIRVRPVDGLTGIAQLADASADVVVLDAYAGGRSPCELTTVEFLTDAARVLRPGGTMLLNIADEPNKAFLRRAYAGLVTVFGHVAIIGTHEVLKGKRFGNTVAVASRAPLDLAALRRQVAKSSFPTGLREGSQLAREFAGSAAFTLADSSQSPPPPPLKGWRVR